MAKTAKTATDQTASVAPIQTADEKATSDLANAVATGVAVAIERLNPVKKTFATKKPQTPWTPKDGSAKLKLKRKMYQHGLELDDKRLSNKEIDLLNKIRPGVYCDGFVRVVRRRDKGVDIDYPIKSATQKLRLVHSFGIRNLTELCEYVIEESANPKKPAGSEDEV